MHIKFLTRFYDYKGKKRSPILNIHTTNGLYYIHDGILCAILVIKKKKTYKIIERLFNFYVLKKLFYR